MKLTITVKGNLPDIDYDKVEQNGVRFLNRVADVGVERAKRGYANAYYITKFGREREYNVEKNMLSNDTCEIVATGQDVVFMEYGSGVDAIKDENGNYGSGSYSSTEGTGEFATYGSWHVNVGDGVKVKLEGQPPARAMYEASKEIIKQANEIAKEEFSW